MQPLSQEKITAFLSTVPAATENEPMSKHTSFRVGGPSRLYVVAHTSDKLIAAVEAARSLAIPFFVYGGGSNLLVSDDGYEGVVIQVALRAWIVEGETIRAGAGAITALIARKSVEAGLTGFEWAIGVPGTIGGAIFGNAGCYGGEMRDAVASVDVYRVNDGKRMTLSKEDGRFAYRGSRFKSESFVILGCELKLSKAADPSASKIRMEEIVKIRKEKQPLEQSSCGCIFKNHDFKDEKELEILRRQIDEVPESMLKSKRLGAGWLIDQVGMTGRKMGNVEVSSKHGNFFVANGTARAQDIVALISFVKMKVRDELGIELHEEVQYLGF